MSAIFRQYIWRDEYVLSNISRSMLSKNTNYGREGAPFYAPRRAGGKRAKITCGKKHRLAAMSKATSRGLRHHRLRCMDDEGMAPTRTPVGMADLRAVMVEMVKLENQVQKLVTENPKLKDSGVINQSDSRESHWLLRTVSADRNTCFSWPMGLINRAALEDSAARLT